MRKVKIPFIISGLALAAAAAFGAGEDEAVAIVKSWKGEGYYMTLGQAADGLLTGFRERGKQVQPVGWYAEQTLPSHYTVRYSFLLDGANAEMIFIFNKDEGTVSAANDLARAAATIATTVEMGGAAPKSKMAAGGFRSSDDVKVEVEIKKAELLDLYREYLKRNPKAGGKLKVRFTIMPSGDVANLEILETTINYEPLAISLVRAIDAWTFTPASNEVTVSYPFVFYSSQ